MDIDDTNRSLSVISAVQVGSIALRFKLGFSLTVSRFGEPHILTICDVGCAEEENMLTVQ